MIAYRPRAALIPTLQRDGEFDSASVYAQALASESVRLFLETKKADRAGLPATFHGRRFSM